MEIYRPHPNSRLSEEIRRFTLQKDTGELVIWDCLDRKNVFQGTVLMEKDGTPVNETYYQVMFTEGLYAWLQGGEDDTVPVDLYNLSSADEHFAEYESREEFLSDYGFADGKPMYEFYDRMDNLRLELYGNESEELFCGILYRYFYDSKKEKCFRMTGTTGIIPTGPDQHAAARTASMMKRKGLYINRHMSPTERWRTTIFIWMTAISRRIICGLTITAGRRRKHSWIGINRDYAVNGIPVFPFSYNTT